LKDSDITIVAPSQWLGKQARDSRLFEGMQVKVIPNCLNLDLFRPQGRADGFRYFDFEDKKYCVLFGAAYETSRKGGDLLLKALEQLSHRSDIVAFTFGSTDSTNRKFPTDVRHLGMLTEDELRLVYATADLVVVPSREDNLPNIAVESIASGTPCVTFDVGGLSDIVDHRQNGYLAEPFDTSDLAHGIDWILADSNRLDQLSKQARDIAKKRFSIENVINQYMTVYRRKLGGV
jgi:glycosyltransferase involved in cell wall biosynthesis